MTAPTAEDTTKPKPECRRSQEPCTGLGFDLRFGSACASSLRSSWQPKEAGKGFYADPSDDPIQPAQQPCGDGVAGSDGVAYQEERAVQMISDVRTLAHI
jgi:hypothetical protein